MFGESRGRGSGHIERRLRHTTKHLSGQTIFKSGEEKKEDPFDLVWEPEKCTPSKQDKTGLHRRTREKTPHQIGGEEQLEEVQNTEEKASKSIVLVCPSERPTKALGGKEET